MASHTAIDKFALVTDKIVQLLERGTVPWRQPWHSTGSVPSNLLTGHVYRGINPLLCQIDCLIHDWQLPLFVSFSQAKEQGWTIQKGAKSTWIKWGGTGVKTIEKEDGSTTQQFYRSFKWHNVFNVAWIDDSQSDRKISDFIPQRIESETTVKSRVEVVEQFIKNQGATVRYGGNRAFYVPSIDAIQLPLFEDFDSAELFYATYVHELGHWTGHQSRLGRDLSGAFGSRQYTREELVAELTSAFVCNDLRIDVDVQHHASYLHHWLDLLKGDSKAFFSAVGQAQKAAELLLDKAGINQGNECTASG